MAVLDMTASTELCEDTNSRWKNTLRPLRSSTVAAGAGGGGPEKPQWKAAVKVRSPSERSYAEGGSLRTARLGTRGRSETRSTRSRSPSPGLFGSTAASRAKQRDAIIKRSRSVSMAPSPDSSLRRQPPRQRNRSESPVRKMKPARPPSVPAQSQSPPRKPSLTSIMKQNSDRSSSSNSNSSYSSSSVMKSEMENFDNNNIHKTAVWVAPKENPLDFQYFKKNFLDFNDEYQYCYTSSEFKQEVSSKNVRSSKKKVSYADCKKFVPLGFRVL